MDINANETKNELQIVSNILPAMLSFNFDELEAALGKRVGEYKTLIVTEDSLKGAKHAQGELASLRIELEKFRKEKKKEAEAPIKEFEARIKKLIGIVEEAENPLKLAISDYDNKVREEKKKYAEELIKEAILEFELEDKYAARMILKPEFMNLSGTKKAVKEDIKNQANMLKVEQDAEKAKIEMIKTSVANENSRLKVKLDESFYVSMLENGMDFNFILMKIKEQADTIFEQENKPEEIAPDVTYRFQENKPEEVTSQTVMEEIPQPKEESAPAEESPFEIPKAMLPQFEVVFKVTGDYDSIKKLNEYVKAAEGFTYEVVSQKRLSVSAE